jgi:hypothetical protein
MTQLALVEAAVAELRLRGVAADQAAPPLFRLLWGLRIFVPPPLFLGFAGLVALMGGAFAAGMAPLCLLAMVAVWLLASDQLTLRHALAIGTGMSLAAGTLFGLAMATWFRYQARRLSIPDWRRFTASRGAAI